MSQELFAGTIVGLCLVALLGHFNLALGFAAAAALAALFWRRADRFLGGLKKFAERISAGELDARVLPVEKGSLAGAQLALESMAFDLKMSFEKQAMDRRQLETALSGIEDGVLLLDSEGRILYSNGSLEGLFGVKLPEKGGAFYWEVFRDAEMTSALKTVLEGQGALTRELSPAGAGRTLAMSATSLHSQAGSQRSTGALALFYDRTDQKRLEKMRSEFAANVSHELRTPLTAIKASLETLQEGALDDPAVNRKFLEKASHHAERLHELINDLLALASVEEDKRLGRIDRNSRSALSEAFGEARNGLEVALRRAHGSVEASFPEQVPDLAVRQADLRQVLVNLIENALKYGGNPPKIRVTAQVDDGYVEVAVEDRGPGIPPEDLARVFERFYRVDKARSREGQGGSGLGLAIVKHLVENYGGTVGVMNLPEGGCRFWFRLPSATV